MAVLSQVYALLSAPPPDAPRLVELALLQGLAGKRLREGLLNYYRKVNRDSAWSLFFFVLCHTKLIPFNPKVA